MASTAAALWSASDGGKPRGERYVLRCCEPTAIVLTPILARMTDAFEPRLCPFDAEAETWRDGRGREIEPPAYVEYRRLRRTRVVLAAAHLDHDPTNNRPRNVRALCQRCHLDHDRPHHRTRARLTVLMRRALGDLFLRP